MEEMKKLLLSQLTGRIYLTSATEIGDGKYLSKGKKIDYTDEVLRSAFEWFINQIEENEAEGHAIKYPGVPYVLEMRKIKEA